MSGINSRSGCGNGDGFCRRRAQGGGRLHQPVGQFGILKPHQFKIIHQFFRVSRGMNAVSTGHDGGMGRAPQPAFTDGFLKMP